MSTVRINDDIKKEVTPILEDLGLSLSEAINLFLHQIKLNNGIPFNLKRKGIIELNEGMVLIYVNMVIYMITAK